MSQNKPVALWADLSEEWVRLYNEHGVAQTG
jgi:hypothetical protein